LDNLFLTHELYYLALLALWLLDCEPILNIVVSSADESSLLLQAVLNVLQPVTMEKLTPLSKNYTIKVYWHLSSTCCLHLQGTRIQRQEFLRHIGTPPYLQDHRAWHPRIQYWLPIFKFMFVRYCTCPFLAPCASLPPDAHLCMKYCVTSSMGWIYCLTVLSCRMGFCTLVRNSRHASPCLQYSPRC